MLYWLSGLTCTDENFIIKSGAQRAASTRGIALVVPDTSPSEPESIMSSRFLHDLYYNLSSLMVLIFVGGLNIEGDSDSYDFGVGMQRCMPLVYISTQFLF